MPIRHAKQLDTVWVHAIAHFACQLNSWRKWMTFELWNVEIHYRYRINNSLVLRWKRLSTLKQALFNKDMIRPLQFVSSRYILLNIFSRNLFTNWSCYFCPKGNSLLKPISRGNWNTYAARSSIYIYIWIDRSLGNVRSPCNAMYWLPWNDYDIVLVASVIYLMQLHTDLRHICHLMLKLTVCGACDNNACIAPINAMLPLHLPCK